MKKYNRKLKLPIFKTIDRIVYKLCNKCLQYKPMNTEHFYVNKQAICGYKGICIECNKPIPSNRTKTRFNENGQLICRSCKQYKDQNDFSLDKANTARNNRSTECKQCESKRKKLNREINQIEQVNSFLRKLLNGCKSRVNNGYKNKNIDIDIDIEYLISLYYKQQGKCALSGIPMTSVKGKGRHNTNISIDRIDSMKGYTKDNVQLVCSHVNMMKSNLSLEQLLYFCENIIKNNKI